MAFYGVNQKGIVVTDGCSEEGEVKREALRRLGLLDFETVANMSMNNVDKCLVSMKAIGLRIAWSYNDQTRGKPFTGRFY